MKKMITILDYLLVFDNFISETTEESSSSSSSSSSDDDKDRMSEISDSRSYSAEPSSDLGRVEVILITYPGYQRTKPKRRFHNYRS